MPQYVALIDWTDQGVRNFKDTPFDRYEAAEIANSRSSASPSRTSGGRSVPMTSSRRSRPPTTTTLAAAFSVAGQGNLRTATLRAFSREEMRAIISKVS